MFLTLKVKEGYGVIVHEPSPQFIARSDDYFPLGRELSEFLLLPLGRISTRYFKILHCKKKALWYELSLTELQ